MAPYRTAPERRTRAAGDTVAHDDRVLGVLLLLIGAIRVVTAVVRHEVFEAESSIALFMIAVAIGLLLRRR